MACRNEIVSRYGSNQTSQPTTASLRAGMYINEASATITFNTGVAQGSITSPQFFNIFVNALLRMLTVTGQNENISHGLQIGKDQKGDNQQDENDYQFNNIGFIDDISIFADTPEGMQKLLNVVQEFTAWCGMQINVKKTYLLVIDND